ncbi:hypothetical protein [Brachybacterium sp. ACRRE]|uniref:hypothetical protein n=1 Tax=Brachybacterium sp. ACRRE TaxID=2918184 RepID=UPI001EF2D93A|nr:hypothetical protein [Brachybacterium sp. ACRRE]MCG7311187.1 hypothetical protein [Brachybacterium sp. ACRRE]
MGGVDGVQASDARRCLVQSAVRRPQLRVGLDGRRIRGRGHARALGERGDGVLDPEGLDARDRRPQQGRVHMAGLRRRDIDCLVVAPDAMDGPAGDVGQDPPPGSRDRSPADHGEQGIA